MANPRNSSEAVRLSTKATRKQFVRIPCPHAFAQKLPTWASSHRRRWSRQDDPARTSGYDPEELNKSQASFKHRRSVSERSFCGLPLAHPLVGQGNRPGSRYPLSWRLAVAEVVGPSKIEQRADDVSGFMEIPVEIDLCLVQDVIPPSELEWQPDDQRQKEVGGEAQHPLAKRCQRHSFERLQSMRSMSMKALSGFFRPLCHGLQYTTRDESTCGFKRKSRSLRGLWRLLLRGTGLRP